MCSIPTARRELCLPNPSWHWQDPVLSSARFLGGDPGTTKKSLADPHGPGWFLSTEEALGSAASGSRSSWETPAQRESGWLRAFLRCAKVWDSVGGLGLNLSQKCSWIQVHVISGSCLQFGKKGLSCGGRVVWHPPSLQCFPWSQFSNWVNYIIHGSQKIFVDLDFCISNKKIQIVGTSAVPEVLDSRGQ